jgi:hypothetical protein
MGRLDLENAAREAALARLKRLQSERDAILSAFPDLRVTPLLRRAQRRAGRLTLARTIPKRSSTKL